MKRRNFIKLSLLGAGSARLFLLGCEKAFNVISTAAVPPSLSANNNYNEPFIFIWTNTDDGGKNAQLSVSIAVNNPISTVGKDTLCRIAAICWNGNPLSISSKYLYGQLNAMGQTGNVAKGFERAFYDIKIPFESESAVLSWNDNGASEQFSLQLATVPEIPFPQTIAKEEVPQILSSVIFPADNISDRKIGWTGLLNGKINKPTGKGVVMNIAHNGRIMIDQPITEKNIPSGTYYVTCENTQQSAPLYKNNI